jgi:hypothetical protein
MNLRWQLAVAHDALMGVAAFVAQPRWRLPSATAAIAMLALFLPWPGGTYTVLRVPVQYKRVDLVKSEPIVLELALPAGEYQVEPASLGYFADDGAGDVRRFVYSAEVPRGLIFGRPATKFVGGGTPVFVVEVNAPDTGKDYLDVQLNTIRGKVAELNRQRNLLLQADQTNPARRSQFFKTIDALWSNLSFTQRGLADAGWTAQVLRKYPGEVTKLEQLLAADSEARGELKARWYHTEQARIDLLLSQYDLQVSLARLPRRRSEQLLSLGKEQLVRETVLKQIEHLSRAWQKRRDELARLGELAQLELLRVESQLGSAAPAPEGSGVASLLKLTTPGVPQTQPAIPPKPRLEHAVMQAWLAVQAKELESIAAALPALERAKAHIASLPVNDVASLPRMAVAAPDFSSPTLEELRYYGELDMGADPQMTAKILAGLAKQFETPPGEFPAEPEMPETFGVVQRGRQMQKVLSHGDVDTSPWEVAYGLLALERTTSRGSIAPVDGAVDAVLASKAKAQVGLDPTVATRAAVAGQLDLILRNPDSRGLAAYDLAFLRFMRWYAGLELKGELSREPSSGSLETKSYGVSTAAH